MGFIERHIFLLLACVAFVLSALCFVFLEQNAPGATDEQYVVALQERIRQETRVSHNELKQLTARLANTPSYAFGALNQPTQYPYYIFRNKKLLFWSDNRFIPDYQRIANIPYPKLINFDQGRFIVSRARAFHKQDTLDVFSLINVYRQYSNTSSYLQSGYNPGLFSVDPQSVITQKGPSYQNVYDATPVFLFSVVPPKVDPYRNRSTPVNTVILATLAVLMLGIYVVRRIDLAAQVRRYEVGFLWLLGYLVLLRGLMLYVGVPYLFIENDLFNAKYYASSELSPSLGDLMLNSVALVILASYVANNYFRSRTYHYVLHVAPAAQAALSVGCVMLSYVIYYGCFTQLNDLYEKSQYTLDLSLSIDFSPLKVAALVFFVILSLLYFLLQHTLSSLFIRFNSRNRWAGLGLFGLGTLGAAGLCVSLGLSPDHMYLLNGFYFLALYLSRSPRLLYTFQYKTSLYLFFGSFICAATAANVVYEQNIRKDWLTKKDMGKQLLAENDEYGELLLHKAQSSINSDAEIRQAFHRDTLLNRERIQQRVKSLHLDRYFDKYDTEVLSFDADGNPLDNSLDAVQLGEYRRRFQQPRYKTLYSNLYFVNEAVNHFTKEYANFVEIRSPNGALVGYVVLDLKLLTGPSGNVYRDLLADNKTTQRSDMREYSYVFFEKGRNGKIRLLKGTGSYNYERKFPVSTLSNPALYNYGLTLEHTSHLGIRGGNGRTLVVSSAEYPLSAALANLSFLYLVLVLSVIVVIVLYAVQYGFMRFSINYSTRIQILLNVAFFLPLLLVVVIILGVITANYVTNQETNYISNTKNIAANFWTYLDENLKGLRSKESMEQELQTIARDADIDINLFDPTGRLYTSTQKLIYESGHLSRYINPQAYVSIAEDKENQKLLYEALGTKQYSTAYAGIKSPDGQLLGILSVPYFYARPELDKQLLEVVSAALSVFAGLFLLFLVLSYFAAGSLTRPLRLLTTRICRTSLDRLNQQKIIEWKSDDELGLLIKEYNRMLSKLEESKVSLAQSEKQSAWREMAKQVAHEIKNPLTPMKLTLQQLQRTLPGVNPVTHRAVSRTLDSMLEQIDNISDIATSFSDFANMPMPQNELVELSAVLHKAADLFAEDQRVTIRRLIESGPVWVMGDRQLLMRIINNLIINGIQSVQPGERPIIDLRLFTHEGNANIEVHDNGEGIPEPIRPKVFLPNFSTKQGGTGIGLALSKRGIEHAGGNIWFETRVEVGTSFFVEIPLAAVVKSN